VTEASEVSSQRAPQVEQACARDQKPQGRRHEDNAFEEKRPKCFEHRENARCLDHTT
jgi:hypothetical protein